MQAVLPSTNAAFTRVSAHDTAICVISPIDRRCRADAPAWRTPRDVSYTDNQGWTPSPCQKVSTIITRSRRFAGSDYISRLVGRHGNSYRLTGFRASTSRFKGIPQRYFIRWAPPRWHEAITSTCRLFPSRQL